MITNASIVCCGIALTLTVLVPLAVIFGFGKLHPGKQLWLYWLLGAAGFFVTQIVIRIPLLTYFQTQDYFIRFQAEHLALYGFTLAFTAGLFELVGRFVVAMLMKKKGMLTYDRSLAAGLGHGGIEAILIVGITYVNYLIYMFMIRDGSFDAVIAQATQSGVDVTQLYIIRDTLIATAPGIYLLGFLERLLAMTAHLGVSMLVCYGCYVGKPGKYALICLATHTFIDLTTVINLMVGTLLSQTAAYLIIYAILTAVAAASLLIVRHIHKSWVETEVPNETA